MSKAAPEPNGPRIAYCKHCGEMIRKESGTRMLWYHIDGESLNC